MVCSAYGVPLFILCPLPAFGHPQEQPGTSSMFRQTITPPILSLFSSVGTSPLHTLWFSQTDQQLSEDSFIRLIDDGCTEFKKEEVSHHQGSTSETLKMTNLPKDYEGDTGKALNTPVLHIQSPTIPSTFIICPPSGELGLPHPWFHLQVRNLQKEFSFEVGVVDGANRKGRIRWSTFQQLPRITIPPTSRPHKQSLDPDSTAPISGPLLHLPLVFPDASSRPLTAWCTIDINLASIIPKFYSMSADMQEDEDTSTRVHTRLGNVILPSGSFSHVSYVKIYANCRLRRVWLSQERDQNVSGMAFTSKSRNQDEWPAEFQLYSLG